MGTEILMSGADTPALGLDPAVSINISEIRIRLCPWISLYRVTKLSEYKSINDQNTHFLSKWEWKWGPSDLVFKTAQCSFTLLLPSRVLSFEIISPNAGQGGSIKGRPGQHKGTKDKLEGVLIKSLNIHPRTQILKNGFLVSKLPILDKFFKKYIGY